MPFLKNDIMELLNLWTNSIENDKWNADHIHNKLRISMYSQSIHVKQEQNIVELENGLKNVFYYGFGTEIIEKGMIQTWQFLIRNDGESISNASIGIVEIEKIENFKQVYMNNDINYVGYGLELNGGYFRNMSKNDLMCIAAKDLEIKNGDIITMTLDLTAKGSTGMLMFEIERKDNDIVINKIAAQPDSYRSWILAVKLKSKHDRIVLLQRFEKKIWHLQ